MVISIEKQFMSRDDIGKIIPASYHKRRPRKLFTLLDRIHIFVFTATAILSIIAYWDHLWKTGATLITTIILIFVALVGTVYHWRIAWKELKDFVKETGGVEAE